MVNLRAAIAWWRTPMPGRPHGIWVIGALGVSLIGLVLLLPRNSDVQARAAMAGLGSIVSSLGLARPAGAWDAGRIRSWRAVLGDRTMVTIYVLLGGGFVAFGLFAPFGSQ